MRKIHCRYFCDPTYGQKNGPKAAARFRASRLFSPSSMDRAENRQARLVSRVANISWIGPNEDIFGRGEASSRITRTMARVGHCARAHGSIMASALCFLKRGRWAERGLGICSSEVTGNLRDDLFVNPFFHAALLFVPVFFPSARRSRSFGTVKEKMSREIRAARKFWPRR